MIFSGLMLHAIHEKGLMASCLDTSGYPLEEQNISRRTRQSREAPSIDHTMPHERFSDGQ